MRADIWSKFQPLIVECATSLFASCGVALSYDGETDGAAVDGEGMASFVGFTGDRIRGSLLLSTCPVLVARSHPSDLSACPEPALELADWIGELANQLLGRIKNKVRVHGIDFSVSTPVSLAGQELRSGPAHIDDSRFLRFRGGGAELHVQFSATLAPDFAFQYPPAAAVEEPQEGDLMLF